MPTTNCKKAITSECQTQQEEEEMASLESHIMKEAISVEASEEQIQAQIQMEVDGPQLISNDESVPEISDAFTELMNFEMSQNLNHSQHCELAHVQNSFFTQRIC